MSNTNTLCTKNDTVTDAEYSYTQRNEFTSEIYKIEVRNLGIFGIGEFKKLLRKQFSLDASKIKSPKRRDFAYVCFRSQADQEKAISILDGYVWKGKTLKVMTAKANPDPLVKRRREQQESKTDDKDNSSNSKKCKTSIEATCPLASLSYDEQLKYKENEMLDVLKLLGKDLLKVNSSLRKYFHKPIISKSNEDESNSDSVVISSHTNTTIDLLPCKFLGICASPKIEGYRNKSEFTIGKSLNTNTEDVTKDANNKDNDSNIIVGFRLGSYANGSIEVGKIDNLPHIPDNVKKAAKSFELFVEKFSNKYQMFNPENNSGHFRQLCVRSTEMNNDIMMIIGVYSQNLTETQLSELKSDLIEFYKNYETNDEFNLKSLYYQDMKRREIGQLYNPTEHLYGDEHIYDMIHGLKFRISPLAFFQVNTKGAEILYQKAIELANITKNTTVLDICCGTGTIGLCFAKHCKQVIGVDVIDDAIKDAEYNAKVNNIDNVKFYSGNSDDFIQSMVREASYGYLTKDDQDLLAVIDPPRAGLHNKSILAIRNSSNLNRLIYISCNPKSAKRNWIDLCRPESKTYRGEPFIPKLAMAVDMFPHTTHTELIILFERIQDEDENDKVKINKETTTATTTNENVVMETEEIVNETEFLSNQEDKIDNNTMEITDDKNLNDKIEDEQK